MGLDNIKGHIGFIILSTLYDQPRYGYDIARHVAKISNGAFELKEGTLYVALKRLEESKTIKGFYPDEQSQGGKRKYYRITEKGKLRYHQQLEEFNTIATIVQLFGRE